MNLLSFIPGNPMMWLRVGLYAALFSSGVWVGLQWNDDTIADLELERAQFDRDQARADLDQEKKGRDALAEFYKAKLKTAKGKVTHEEIIKLVPVDCTVPEPAIGLLEVHRAGVPYDSRTIAGGSAASAIAGPLSLSGLIQADVDLADMYENCRAQIRAIGQTTSKR